jgi:hypothetical protein
MQLVGLKVRFFSETLYLFANLEIKFLGINLAIWHKTVILLFKGFIFDISCFFAKIKSISNPSTYQVFTSFK